VRFAQVHRLRLDIDVNGNRFVLLLDHPCVLLCDRLLSCGPHYPAHLYGITIKTNDSLMRLQQDMEFVPQLYVTSFVVVGRCLR